MRGKHIRIVDMENLLDFLFEIKKYIDPKYEDKFEKLRTQMLKEMTK